MTLRKQYVQQNKGTDYQIWRSYNNRQTSLRQLCNIPPPPTPFKYLSVISECPYKAVLCF